MARASGGLGPLEELSAGVLQPERARGGVGGVAAVLVGARPRVMCSLRVPEQGRLRNRMMRTQDRREVNEKGYWGVMMPPTGMLVGRVPGRLRCMASAVM